MFRELQNIVLNGHPDDSVWAAPRGNAKSTIVSMALIIWVSLYKHKRYTLLVSDTADQADDFLSNVKTEFENNDQIIDDFGLMQGEVWTSSNIILANEVRIQSLGAGKKVRGRRHMQFRPDLIVCDDLENDESVVSQDQRKKTDSWYKRALSKAGAEYTDKIVVGTVIHPDSLLAKLLKNPAYLSHKYRAVIEFSHSPKWDEWEALVTNLDNPTRLADARAFYETHKDEMLEGTSVLWAKKEDYYSLMLQRIADGPAAFSSEKQNEPINDDDRRFEESWIHYYDDAELIGKDLFIVGYVDPSMGKKGGDYSAIIVIAIDVNGQIYVLVADIQRRDPELIISDSISIQRQVHMQVLGVEIVAFQEYFKNNFVKAVQALEEEDKRLSLSVRGVKVNTDKILRIQSLQPDIKSGRIKFKREHTKLIEQLVGFPTADHDDGPDALAGAVQLLGRRSAIQEYYKEQTNESNQQDIQSFLQNSSLQRLT